MAFLSKDHIKSMGFQSIGENVLLSDKASYYNCKNIAIGNNTRTDDFTVLSAGEGGIEIGQYVHIAIGVSVIGSGKILIKNFLGLSSKVSVYSSNDDYSGEFMTNPTVPDSFINVSHGVVSIGRHVIVGSGSVILPNVTLGAIGALSLVTKNCSEFGVYIGSPAKKIKERSRNLLSLESQLMNK